MKVNATQECTIPPLKGLDPNQELTVPGVQVGRLSEARDEDILPLAPNAGSAWEGPSNLPWSGGGYWDGSSDDWGNPKAPPIWETGNAEGWGF